MARRPRRIVFTDLRALTVHQRSELAEGFSLFVLGDGQDSYFASAEEAREAWRLHGPDIMRAWRTPWRRPRGWWLYEHSRPIPATAYAEQEALCWLGLATKKELGMIATTDARELLRDLAGHGHDRGVAAEVVQLLAAVSELEGEAVFARSLAYLVAVARTFDDAIADEEARQLGLN